MWTVTKATTFAQLLIRLAPLLRKLQGLMLLTLIHCQHTINPGNITIMTPHIWVTEVEMLLLQKKSWKPKTSTVCALVPHERLHIMMMTLAVSAYSNVLSNVQHINICSPLAILLLWRFRICLHVLCTYKKLQVSLLCSTNYMVVFSSCLWLQKHEGGSFSFLH